MGNKTNRINYKKFWSEIKQNDGGSFGEHERFIISVSNNTFNNDLTFNDFKKEVKKLKPVMKYLNNNSFLGYWKNEKLLYIDVNISTENQNEALILGKTFNQKAVFDYETKTEIFI